MTVPQGWEEKRLDQWGTIVSGATPSTTVPTFWDGNIVWVTPFDLSRLHTPRLTDSSKKITAAGLNACSAQLLPPGSVVLSSRAPIGYVALPSVPFCTNQGCKSLKLRNGVDPYFAYYNLLFNIDKIKHLGEGTTFAEISKAALSTIPLSFPTNPSEQTKIAAVLSTVDHAIEHTEQLIAKRQRVKTGLMQDLLTRGIDERGNIRSEQTHRFKSSPLGRIPEEWNAKRFEEITPRDAPIGYGIVQPGPFDHAGVPVAGIYTINTAFEQWHKSSRSIEQAYRRSRIRSDDVLLSIKGTTGRVGVVPVGLGGNISREIARIRPLESMNPHFLRFLMLSDFFQKYLQNAEVGTTRAEISIKILRELFVLTPPRPEQDEVVRRLASVEQDLREMQRQLAKCRLLKTGLMQDLLSGRKRVTTLLDAATETMAQVS